MSRLPPLTRTRHKHLNPLAKRLGAIFAAQDSLPRNGPVPAELRGEARRVFNGIDRFLPPGDKLAESGWLPPSRRPEMFGLFYATLEAIAALNGLTALPKLRRGETYPRGRKLE